MAVSNIAGNNFSHFNDDDYLNNICLCLFKFEDPQDWLCIKVHQHLMLFLILHLTIRQHVNLCCLVLMENILLGSTVLSMLKFVWVVYLKFIIIFLWLSFRVILVKTSDWKTVVEADYRKATQLAFSSKGTYLIVYEPFMSKYLTISL